MIRPQPTKRFVVDVGHHCNMNCKFCYHHHEGDLTKASFLETRLIKEEIEKGLSRGNTWCDFTGGEPTLLPDMPGLIADLHSRGIGVTIITNGVTPLIRVEKLIDAGLDEFLVSIHGMRETHDKITITGARDIQEKFLTYVKDLVKIRFNFVINQYNQNEIIETVKWMLQWKPTIVNFINFNPHHGWQSDLKSAEEIIAGFYIVEPRLNDAIGILEENGIGVNVRYYPMCRIAEQYRRCICNDLHVVFDPYEWDYCIPVKTEEKYLQWCIGATNNTECKDYPCHDCDLQWICGGLNKCFLNVAGPDCLTVQKIEFKNYQDRFYVYHYRQHNELTLKEPVRKAAQ